MKPVLFLAPLALAAVPAPAQHGPISPALSGRSPHVATRPAAAEAASCHAVRASGPAGRQPVGLRAEPACPDRQTAARDRAEAVAFGR